MIKISIIVPVFRIKIEYFRDCIESLRKQTLTDIEIILIDDGSKDECETLCDRYASIDNRIRVIHQDNQGVSVARNVGIKLAQGEWITFVDADDYVEADLCEKILNYATRNNSDIAMFSNYIHQDNIVYEHSFFGMNIDLFSEMQRQEFQLRTMILHYPDCSYHPRYMLIGHTFGKLIRKDYLLKSNILFDPDLRLQQDGIFYLQLTEQRGNMSYLNEPLYHYRVYDTSNCKKVRKDTEIIYNKVRTAFLDFIMDHKKPVIYYDAFYAKCISDISQNLKSNFFHKAVNETLIHRLKRLNCFLKTEPFHTAIQCANRNYLTKLKKRNLFYYRHNLLLLLWLDWKLYNLFHYTRKK